MSFELDTEKTVVTREDWYQGSFTIDTQYWDKRSSGLKLPRATFKQPEEK